jgi:excisionase family DNA binding protein
VQEPPPAAPGAAFPHHGETGRLLDRSEVAERLHVSPMTVRRLGASGRLDEIRVGERAIRIPEESVERHLAERRITRERTTAA